jgi:hypothetical protein
MLLTSIVALLVFLFHCAVYATSNNLTDIVTWDPYSILIKGERAFIFAGEFHYQRLPVPELWLDVFQKFKAEGFNAVSVYFFWSYHSPSKGVYDFQTSGKDVQRLFDYAKEAGIYVIARAGPYCNAETNGGGLGLYLSDGSGGKLRSSNESYHEAWMPWIQEIGKIIAKNQITNGGPVILNQIENELQETSHNSSNTLVLYMEQVESAFRNAGIVVPSTSNEKGERSQSWSTDYQNVGGAVNIYGLDSYPGGLSCANPNSGFNVVRNYYQWFQNYSFTQPEYFPEFEGGYFTPWGGNFYDTCTSELSPQFADVYYKNNIGQRTTLQSLYMAFGGTNWGYSAAPVVYTSYDYSAPLRETREIRDKLKQIKLIGLFTRVSKDLLMTTMEGNGTGYALSTTDVWSWVLRNSDTKAGFYIFQQNNTSSQTPLSFEVYLNTTHGPVHVPDVSLDGRQSKILVTDYKFGSHSLLYSSAEVLTFMNLGDVDVLVLYLDVGQKGSFAFTGQTSKYKLYGTTSDFRASNGSFSYTQSLGATVVQFSDGPLIYLLDRVTAYNFHAPSLTNDPVVRPNQHVFVLGPHLVRTAKIYGETVSLTGDLSNSTLIEVYAGKSAKTLIWNGKVLETHRSPYGSLLSTLKGPENRQVTLPVLKYWKTANSLPETSYSYNDSKWTVCNQTRTLSPVSPFTFPILFSSDYGFYTGPKIYRGRFVTNSSAPVLNITAQNGLSSGWSAWLNGIFLYSEPGNASLSATTAHIPLPSSLLKPQNLLTVLVDYTGHDETSTGSGVENPRGLLGAEIIGGIFTNWKITGNAGGSLNLDPVRGPMNEGGLHGERLGWHLPGFNTESWPLGSPLTGISQAGVQWYVSTFSLDLDNDLDVPLGISFSAPNGTVARVSFWINGYLYGKYVPHIGPQTVFPVPPGIINNSGPNTIAVALWAQNENGAKLSEVKLISYGVYETGYPGGFAKDWEYLQPKWTSEREKYV